MANDYSWIIKGVVAGAIAGIMIWVLIGINDIINIMMSSWYLDIIPVLRAVVSY
jgi:hypothetical protein